MLILEEGIQFAKSVVKFLSGSTTYPKPPRMIMQGGAGSAKSAVISKMVQWMEKIFHKESENPGHPYILVCAPTGTAAAVIHGQTLHHSFSFNFGNEYKARDHNRSLLQNSCNHWGNLNGKIWFSLPAWSSSQGSEGMTQWSVWWHCNLLWSSPTQTNSTPNVRTMQLHMHWNHCGTHFAPSF